MKLFENKFRFLSQNKSEGFIYYTIDNLLCGYGKDDHIKIEHFAGKNTGLKDKNNKEIYEGDIVGIFGKRHYLVKVFWNELDHRWGIIQGNDILDSRPLDFLHGKDYFISGNIYENPELSV